MTRTKLFVALALVGVIALTQLPAPLSSASATSECVPFDSSGPAPASAVACASLSPEDGAVSAQASAVTCAPGAACVAGVAQGSPGVGDGSRACDWSSSAAACCGESSGIQTCAALVPDCEPTPIVCMGPPALPAVAPVSMTVFINHGGGGGHPNAIPTVHLAPGLNCQVTTAGPSGAGAHHDTINRASVVCTAPFGEAFVCHGSGVGTFHNPAPGYRQGAVHGTSSCATPVSSSSGWLPDFRSESDAASASARTSSTSGPAALSWACSGSFGENAGNTEDTRGQVVCLVPGIASLEGMKRTFLVLCGEYWDGANDVIMNCPEACSDAGAWALTAEASSDGFPTGLEVDGAAICDGTPELYAYAWVDSGPAVSHGALAGQSTMECKRVGGDLVSDADVTWSVECQDPPATPSASLAVEGPAR